ncbi:MAG: TenA family protein, partial [Alphaproteobacteria bacterium]|nr:TenA family protein [Alphaproteobacteria bacterium]
MAFCDDIWERVAALRQTIFEMPFNKELMDGSLPQETFQHYMLQDSLYLEAYSRVLSILSARARNADHMLEFSQAAQVALVVERELHEGFFEKFGLSEADISSAQPSPTTMNYCNYLIATAYGGSFAESLAAVLPCFWVYWEVGMYIHERAEPGNPYQAWIDTYAGEEFADAVKRVIA